MFKIVARGQIWEFKTPQVMAIMNATSNSFYKESQIMNLDLALSKTNQFIKEGASIIDIGGQSTRPGANLYTPKEELNNVLPMIEAVYAEFPNILISVDTFHSSVAAEAIKAGAHIVNDISCGNFDDNMLKVVAVNQAGYIGMHCTGTPNTMHEIPVREDIIKNLIAYFQKKRMMLSNNGIQDWVIDPGFGFGKSIVENFKIVKNISELNSIGLPILLGVSRKSTIYKTLQVTAEEALNGTTVLNTVGVLNGASIIRVHDVKEAKQIIDLYPYLAT